MAAAECTTLEQFAHFIGHSIAKPQRQFGPKLHCARVPNDSAPGVKIVRRCGLHHLEHTSRMI
jgi:hypothetical protein